MYVYGADRCVLTAQHREDLDWVKLSNYEIPDTIQSQFIGNVWTATLTVHTYKRTFVDIPCEYTRSQETRTDPLILLLNTYLSGCIIYLVEWKKFELTSKVQLLTIQIFEW